LIGGWAAGGSAVALGAAVALSSAVLYDVGYVLEKQALSALPSLPTHPLRLWRTCARSPRWLAGFVAMLAGLGLQLIALTLAPVTVVQPILAAGVLGVAAAGRLVLGERLGPREGLALMLVVLAVAAITVSAIPGGQVARSAAEGRFLATAVPAAAVAIALLLMFTRRRSRLSDGRPGPAAGSGNAVGNGTGSVMKGSAVDRPGDAPAGGPTVPARAGVGGSSMSVRYGVAALAAAAGLLYGVGAIAEKAVATRMVDNGIDTGALRSLSTGYPWAFVLATLAGMIAFQICLQRHYASMVVPLTNVISSVCVLTGAALVFSERLVPAGWWALPRLTGFAAVLAAVVVLAAEREPVATPALV
jgi:multidrug transporter EmrE-like cation transporter